LAQAEKNKALIASYGGELKLLEGAADSERLRPSPPDAGGPILEFNEVSKEFPVKARRVFARTAAVLHAVTDVNLAIRPGEAFGLVGESGCGKTTLGRMAVGLEVPSSGQVLFNQADINSVRAGQFRVLRRDLQFMFQDPYSSLDPRMRVKEIIGEPLDVARRGSKKERAEAVRGLLDQVGLGYDAIDRYPHEFSGGQRQRLGLARALALNPSLIVADEPVSALDVSIRSQILNLMKRLQASYGLTYVVISHDLSVVRYLADRIGVMYLGRLVEVAPANSIYGQPAHPYTAGLIEAIPLPNPTATRRQEARIAIRGELPSPVYPPSGCRFRTRCPRAQERCAQEVPALRPFGHDHVAACHFPLQTPVQGQEARAPTAVPEG
jgi:oligopeptide/dipeptide ABC transporter ATP-binding protein